MTKEEIDLAKSKMQYVVYGVNAKMADRPASNKRGKKNKIVSSCFNDQGARPIFKRVFKQQVLHANLRIDLPVWLSSSVTVPVFVGQQFNLGQFNDTSEYTTLFDQYRFNYIEVWIEPASAFLSSANTGILSSTVDLDDANTPSSVQNVEGKQTSISSNGVTGHYHRWNPHMAVAAYSGVFTAFANDPAGWIDCSSNTVQHYGIKAGITATTAIYNWNVTVRANISFRQAGI